MGHGLRRQYATACVRTSLSRTLGPYGVETEAAAYRRRRCKVIRGEPVRAARYPSFDPLLKCRAGRASINWFSGHTFVQLGFCSVSVRNNRGLGLHSGDCGCPPMRLATGLRRLHQNCLATTRRTSRNRICIFSRSWGPNEFNRMHGRPWQCPCAACQPFESELTWNDQ